VTPRQQSRQTGVFSDPLERIVDPGHPLCALAGKIDWREFDVTFGSLYHPGNGRPGTPTRLMVGLHYLKHTFNQSDEAVVARWLKKVKNYFGRVLRDIGRKLEGRADTPSNVAV
jgi:IS5 family transposase